MNSEQLGLTGAAASGVLLLLTAHPVFLLALIGSSAYFGWNLGKRLIPAEEYGG